MIAGPTNRLVNYTIGCWLLPDFICTAFLDPAQTLEHGLQRRDGAQHTAINTWHGGATAHAHRHLQFDSEHVQDGADPRLSIDREASEQGAPNQDRPGA